MSGSTRVGGCSGLEDQEDKDRDCAGLDRDQGGEAEGCPEGTPTRELRYRIVRLRFQGTQVQATGAPAARHGKGQSASTSKENRRIGDLSGDAAWCHEWCGGRRSDARRPDEEQLRAPRPDGWHRSPHSQFLPAPQQSPRSRPGVTGVFPPRPSRATRWKLHVPRRSSSPISRVLSSRATGPSSQRLDPAKGLVATTANSTATVRGQSALDQWQRVFEIMPDDGLAGQSVPTVYTHHPDIQVPCAVRSKGDSPSVRRPRWP